MISISTGLLSGMDLLPAAAQAGSNRQKGVFGHLSRFEKFVRAFVVLVLVAGLSSFGQSLSPSAAADCPGPTRGKVPKWARIGLDDLPHVIGDSKRAVGYLFGSGADGSAKVLWVTSTAGKQMKVSVSSRTFTFPPAVGTNRTFPSVFPTGAPCTAIGIRWGSSRDRISPVDLRNQPSTTG